MYLDGNQGYGQPNFGQGPNNNPRHGYGQHQGQFVQRNPGSGQATGGQPRNMGKQAAAPAPEVSKSPSLLPLIESINRSIADSL
jgi:hypothetical protein